MGMGKPRSARGRPNDGHLTRVSRQRLRQVLVRWATLPNPKPDASGAFSANPMSGSPPTPAASLAKPVIWSGWRDLVRDLQVFGTEGHEVEPDAPEFGPRRELSSSVLGTPGESSPRHESLYFRQSPAFFPEILPHVPVMGNQVIYHPLENQRLQFRHMILQARFVCDPPRNYIAFRIEHHIGLNYCGIQYGIQQVGAGAQPNQGSRQHQQEDKQRGQARVIPNTVPDHNHYATDKKIPMAPRLVGGRASSGSMPR